MKSKLGRMIAILAFGSFVAFAGETSAQQRTKVGTLRCGLAPAVGLIVVEKQRLSCSYTPDGPVAGWVANVKSTPLATRQHSLIESGLASRR